jgi:hypothetical protein
MQVLSMIEKKVVNLWALATLYRRGCQTTLRCCFRKGAVVNGREKLVKKNEQVSDREMNESELLMK